MEAIMGLLDSLGGVLKGAMGEAEAAALPALVNAVLAKTQYHDLNGVRGGAAARRPRRAGQILARQRHQSSNQRRAAEGGSWQRPGAGIRPHLGLPVDQTLDLLAKYLPEIVDKASPNGTLQPST
jgi:hypothetical protein